MHRAAVLAALVLLLLGLQACSVSNYSIEQEGVKLAERPIENGKVVYRLFPGNLGPPHVHRTETVTRPQAEFDAVVTSITGDLAKRLGVQAWDGVWIERIGGGSNAMKAGLVPGDILRTVDGVQVVSKQQFDEVLAERLTADRPLKLEVLREMSSATGPRERRDIQVLPDLETVTETRTDSIALPLSQTVQRLTGLQVATIPPDLAQEIYQAAGPVTIVAGVVPGSPAYLAGLRKGDRVVAVDGEDDPALADVRRAVLARAGDVVIPAEALEAEPADPLPLEDRSGDVRLDVVGPLGEHRATLAVTDDIYRSGSEFHFPILFDYESDVDSTEWEFLDFIFQFGATYDGRYLTSSSRNATRSSKLSLFPFGMFEFEFRPTYNRYTFLWFIRFKTRG